MRLGFLGLGLMGTPMALNLARRFPLTVWNRTASKAKYESLVRAGASVGETPVKVAQQSDAIFFMLSNDQAIQSLLSDNFRRAIRGKTIINTSTVTADFNKHLDRYVRNAGGEFVEMPVSGSKVPAEQGRLVGIMAGDRSVSERIRPLVEPFTAAAIYCGPVGSGLRMKYAINLYLVTMNVSLTESFNLAKAQGLDLEAFGRVLEAGPLASDYSGVKVAKMQNNDWTPEGAMRDCYKNALLVQSAVEEARTQAPLANLTTSLYARAIEAGLGGEDMVAVVKLLSQPYETKR